MPWTLYRHILGEMLKLLALTAGILVVVVSGAATLQYTGDAMLEPMAVLRFLGFIAPTMLVYVLPFAAAFAATFVYIRLANDNEILACSASGISYRNVLMPAFLLGLALTMTLFLLANFVLPHLYRQARLSVETDILSVLVHRLNEGEAYDGFSNLVIHADAARQGEPPHMPEATLQPQRLIELHEMAVGWLDEDGRFESDATARYASILLFRDGDRSWVTIRLRDAMYYDPRRGLGYNQSLSSAPLELPNPFSDHPRFFSWPQLRDLEDHPERYDRVARAKNELARQLAVQQLHLNLRGAWVGPDPPGELTLAGNHEGERYRIVAPAGEADGEQIRLRQAGGTPVRVYYESPRYADRLLEAERAEVAARYRPEQLRPTVRVSLEDVRVQAADGQASAAEHARLSLPRLHWHEPLLPAEPEALSAAAVLELASQPAYYASPAVAEALDDLREEIQSLAHRIVGQLHDRAASAVACLLLMVLGAVLSIHLRGQMPLAVFFWAFLLAIVNILLIYTGERSVRDVDQPIALGLGILWSGNVGLGVVIVWVYGRVGKH